ncbi:hypothetical protein, partial [Riemerella anatipestifer]|uniref:hypothetical protein n=2 Tax=Riemerella anatipestifer TaxID=34085 RepID=UPI0021B09097
EVKEVIFISENISKFLFFHIAYKYIKSCSNVQLLFLCEIFSYMSANGSAAWRSGGFRSTYFHSSTIVYLKTKCSI